MWCVLLCVKGPLHGVSLRCEPLNCPRRCCSLLHEEVDQLCIDVIDVILLHSAVQHGYTMAAEL